MLNHMMSGCQVEEADNGECSPVLLVAGAAGSGKTTLGRAVAAALHLAVLDLDQLTNPLLDALGSVIPGDHWLSGPHAAQVRAGRYAVLRAAAADLVGLGQGAVLIAPFTAELRGGTEWEELVTALEPATVWVIHLDGPPEILAQRRRGRGASRDAFRPPDSAPEPPAVPHLRVEVSLSTAEQVELVLRHLEC